MRRLTRRLAVKAMLLLLCAAAPRALPVNNPGRAPQQAAPARRPLRILALGDSVMWGQGLKDENKFTYKLRDWLCGRRGNPDCQNEQDVELHVEAHSGATILEDDGKLKKLKDKFRPPGPPRKYAGEVNYSHPTLWAQLDRARSYYGSHAGEVDLVLVNGGINDVNATNILVRGLFSGNLKKRAEKYCGKEMKPFLLKVADAFPNARIVVPGYFPLITKSTPPHIVFETMWELLFRDEEGEAEEFAAFQEDWKAPPGESAAEAGVRVSKKIEWLANRSSDFVKASDAALEYAVNELNKDRPLPGASARGLFVPVEFGDHGYGTVETFLWKLGRKAPDLVLNCARDNFVTRFVVNDEMQKERPCACEEAVKAGYPRTKYLICFRAGTFHPNREGANAYFEAIKAKLGNILDSTGWIAEN